MKILPIILIVLACVFCVPAVQAATIFSDNFNGENGGVGALNYNTFSNWTVSNGAVDLIGVGGVFDFFPGNGLYVDLDGTVSKAGLFSSTALSLNAGTYTLQFSLGGSHRGESNTVQVALGSFYNEIFTLGSNDPLGLVTRTVNVVAPGTASLTFQNNGTDNMGAILDNVTLNSLSSDVAAVPESLSLTMLVMGITGIGLLRRNGMSLRSSR